MKDKKTQNKNPKQGFTLLELLVVVVIIGILAAIALPQYRMIVLKSKFAKVKANVQALTSSMHRHYLVNNCYPKKLDELDIEVKDKDDEYYHTSTDNRGDITGTIKTSDDKPILAYHIVLGKPYSWQTININVYYCIAYSKNHSGNYADIANKVCQQETGKIESVYNTVDYTWYAY